MRGQTNNNKISLYQNYQRNLIKATVATNVGINSTEKVIKVYGASANRVELLTRLRKYSRFTLIWYLTFFFLGIVCLFLDPAGWVYVLDLYVVMFNIDLVARGKLSGIYIGIIECFLYAFISLQSALYGEVIKVLAICAPLNVVSIIRWKMSAKKQKQDKFAKKNDDIIVNKLSKKEIVQFLGIGAIVAVGCYCLLRFVIGQTTALELAAISLTLSIIGKIFTARMNMEAWILCITNDIICLFMWLQTIFITGFDLSQVSMIVYYLACFTNDSYAFSLWKSMYRKIAVNGGKILAMRKVNIKRIIKLRRQFHNMRWNREVDVNKNS